MSLRRCALFQAEVAAAPAVVWDLLARVEDWPGWTPTVERIVNLSGQSLAMGRQYKVKQPGLREAVYTITGLEDCRRFTWESRLPGTRLIADHIVEEVGGKTRLELSFSAEGVMGALVQWLYGGKIASFVETEGRSLKRAAEVAAA